MIIQKTISLMAAAGAIGDCFLLAAALCLVALALCFFLKEKKAETFPGSL